MRILHCADLHIGSKMETRLTKERARARKRELLLGLRELMKRARDAECDAMIIAGDLFDEERVGERTLRSAMDIIREAEPLPVYYLPGNHEGGAVAAAGQLPQNLRLFGAGWTEYEQGGVRIAGRSECEAELLRGLEKSELPTVLVLHGELRERSDAGGAIGRRELAESGAVYVALGHYHSFAAERLTSGGAAVYAGAPWGRGFDETGAKGYVIAEIDEGGARYEFRELPGRRMLRIEVPVDGLGLRGVRELEERIEATCGAAKSDDLVRICLTGHRAADVNFDTGLLEHRFGERFFYFEVRDETRLEILPASYEHDRTLKGEFIRTVLAAEELSEREKEDIIICGLSALMGERLE